MDGAWAYRELLGNLLQSVAGHAVGNLEIRIVADREDAGALDVLVRGGRGQGRDGKGEDEGLGEEHGEESEVQKKKKKS